MINHIYQLIAPKVVSVKYADVQFGDKVIVRPEKIALCHADQRYYYGKRDVQVLNQKLPMALIHECCGKVVYDPTGRLIPGQKVVLIPNVPPKDADGVIYENYVKGAYFRSSGHDGFMQELIEIDADRVVPYAGIDSSVAAICEFVSVGVHATTRFDLAAHKNRERIAIWGDGSLSYVVGCIIKKRFPQSKLIIIGHQPRKLAQFSFADETYLTHEVPSDLRVDHAFECCGGEGSYYAIEGMIDHVNPQGTLVLMGVSENRVAINTRMVLERGYTLVGCSRSGREDFELAISLMEQEDFQKRLKVIIFEDGSIRSIADISRVFADDLTTPFKTVASWEL